MDKLCYPFMIFEYMSNLSIPTSPLVSKSDHITNEYNQVFLGLRIKSNTFIPSLLLPQLHLRHGVSFLLPHHLERLRIEG